MTIHTKNLIKIFDRIESIIPTIQDQQQRQKLGQSNHKLGKLFLNHSIKGKHL